MSLNYPGLGGSNKQLLGLPSEKVHLCWLLLSYNLMSNDFNQELCVINEDIDVMLYGLGPYMFLKISMLFCWMPSNHRGYDFPKAVMLSTLRSLFPEARLVTSMSFPFVFGNDQKKTGLGFLYWDVLGT